MFLYSRKSPRLAKYDYTSAGMYFVTICTKNSEYYFGEIRKGVMMMNELGKMALNCRKEISKFHPHVEVGEFICMPNHIHGILIIGEKKNVGTQYLRPVKENNQDVCNTSVLMSVPICLSESLGSIVRGFKVGVTKYAKQNNLSFARHSRYHDHIIKNEREYVNIKQYIQNNPQQWLKDTFNKNTIKEI